MIWNEEPEFEKQINGTDLFSTLEFNEFLFWDSSCDIFEIIFEPKEVKDIVY